MLEYIIWRWWPTLSIRLLILLTKDLTRHLSPPRLISRKHSFAALYSVLPTVISRFVGIRWRKKEKQKLGRPWRDSQKCAGISFSFHSRAMIVRIRWSVSAYLFPLGYLLLNVKYVRLIERCLELEPAQEVHDTGHPQSGCLCFTLRCYW